MQISIDNVVPDDVSKKSLKTLDAPDKEGRVHSKLKLLRQHATFQVNINSVLGGGTREPRGRTHDQQTRARARVHHLDRHHPRRAGTAEAARSAASARSTRTSRGRSDGMTHVVKNIYSGIRDFQSNLVDGKPNEWRCRAGARYLYICENGLVHYCSQQRGMPGIPLEQYTPSTSAASSTPRSPARPTARSAASTGCRSWISGGSRRPGSIRFRRAGSWRSAPRIAACRSSGSRAPAPAGLFRQLSASRLFRPLSAPSVPARSSPSRPRRHRQSA